MKSTIDNLKKQGFIEQENIGFDQVSKHINRAYKDLKVAKANLNIDSEASYNYSYLAMLRTGRALMFSFSYRPIDGQQHKTVVQFCGTMLGKSFVSLVSSFDHMRKFRNKFTYDEAGILVSRQETEQSLKRAEIFVEKVTQFIQKKNPQKKLI
ncbi:MAG: HEPN domain-containing protein [Candidatus Nealsonbacteria bacterium]